MKNSSTCEWLENSRGAESVVDQQSSASQCSGADLIYIVIYIDIDWYEIFFRNKIFSHIAHP